MKHPYVVTNLVLAIIFIILSVLIWVRQSDGAGVQQDVALRWIAFLVLMGFLLIVLIVEAIIFWLNHRNTQ